MKTSKTILFFGSGPVAAESLRLLAENFTIEAVVTKPRAEHHHGDVPVISVAEELKLPVHTVTNKSDLDSLIGIKPFTSELGILIDFGIIVSQSVIDYFTLGIINSHFSLLPEWRGADPLSFAILSGQKHTGVSLMLIVEAMDEGPILAYGEYDIPETCTTPQLTADLIALSNGLLTTTIPMYISGECRPVPQDTSGHSVSYSRKLTKDDSQLQWSKPAQQLEREVRAFIEWPRSRTLIGTYKVIVTAAHVEDRSGSVGELWHSAKELGVFTSDGLFIIDKLIPEGKKEMSAQAFLAGYRL
jgi:methionyl-tRNA formyltransferase